MQDALRLGRRHNVLEIGAGYSTALLIARFGRAEVSSVEVSGRVADMRHTLGALGIYPRISASTTRGLPFEDDRVRCHRVLRSGAGYPVVLAEPGAARRPVGDRGGRANTTSRRERPGRHRAGRLSAVGLTSVSRQHRRHLLPSAACSRCQRGGLRRPQREADGEGLTGSKRHGWQRAIPVQAVSAGAPSAAEDGHARLPQGVEIPLDGAHADLEPPCQPRSTAWSRRHRSKLLDQRVEAISTGHHLSVRATTNTLPGCGGASPVVSAVPRDCSCWFAAW